MAETKSDALSLPRIGLWRRMRRWWWNTRIGRRMHVRSVYRKVVAEMPKETRDGPERR